MITMIHANWVRVDGETLLVDRKFHLGMQNYLSAISHPIVSIHPESDGSENTMDMVEVPLKGLGYGVMAINGGSNATKAVQDASRMADQIRSSRLVYGGGMGSEALCAGAGVPQIAVLEYNLATQIKVSTSQVTNPLRKASRALKVSVGYIKGIANLRRSAGIHCNGYPTFDATAAYNANRLLYLDSRMYESMVISEAQLEARLNRPNNAPLKLLFSGRYDPIKGALDAVRQGLFRGNRVAGPGPPARQSKNQRPVALSLRTPSDESFDLLLPRLGRLFAGKRELVHGSLPTILP